MDAIIQVMESAIAARDLYTVAHQQRTTHLADLIAAEIDLPVQSRRDLHVAGRLHDLGKIAVPGDILSKHGKLNYFEFALIKIHPQMACDILRPLKITNIIQIILQHHERLDGSGYPLGLRGNEILLEAKILAVADVVDAICWDRPYRPSLGMDQALEEITDFKGTLYEAAVVDACMDVYEKWIDVISLDGSLIPGPQPDIFGSGPAANRSKASRQPLRRDANILYHLGG
jgi:HD-GYP domain-containing protein (c-di-GMP phosphodiesterase class II)